MLNGASKARFEDCLFLKWSTVNTNFMCRIDSALPIPIGLLIFENCLFSNRGGAGATLDVFNRLGAGELRILLRNCLSQGSTGWSDDLTVIWSNGPAPVNTFGLALNPAA